MFSFKTFVVSHLTFQSLIYFEFISVYGVKERKKVKSLIRVRICSNFILIHVAVQFFQHNLLKRQSFVFNCIFLPCLSKVRCPQVHGFISGLSVLFQWSVFLFFFFCHYHTVLIAAPSQCSLKSGRLILPAPFFFLKIALAIQSLFYSIQI